MSGPTDIADGFSWRRRRFWASASLTVELASFAACHTGLVPVERVETILDATVAMFIATFSLYVIGASAENVLSRLVRPR